MFSPTRKLVVIFEVATISFFGSPTYLTAHAQNYLFCWAGSPGWWAAEGKPSFLASQGQDLELFITKLCPSHRRESPPALEAGLQRGRSIANGQAAVVLHHAGP